MQALRLFVASAVLSLALAACGGGGGSVPIEPSTGSSTTGVSATATPSVKATATATPAAGSSAPAATPTAVATTSSSSSSIYPPPTSPPQASGYTNVVPANPAPGTCRTGEIYSIYVDTPTGDTEAFTVFEPANFCGGMTYPLVLQGAGYSGSRQTSLGTVAQDEQVASPGNIGELVAANYGVISLDERGFGEDGGTVRVMDPNFEGLMDLSVMDWAQANLTWLSYGPTNDGLDPHEPIMGSIGGSYGGMYQYMLLNLDKRHRLRAIAPQISPSDLNYSLFPNGVVKTDWDLDLFGLGETGGNDASRGHEDPFLMSAVESGIEMNLETQPVHDFFGYHSASYFCNGQSVASDGDAGSLPLFQPTTMPPKINALISNGMRDTLFTFNNAYNNYSCFKQAGGDVRLLSYQYGHNALQVVPDPYVTLYYPPTEFLDQECGSLEYDTATLAWFNQYLKGQSGAANAGGIPTEPCMSIEQGDAVLVPSVTTGTNGTEFAIPSTTVVAGSAPDVPMAVPLGPAATAAEVIAGIPYMKLDVEPVSSTLGEPIIFVGVGQLHASQPTAYDLLDNQVTPIRGSGEHDIDMTGIAARLAAGDQLALLIYGASSQYSADGNTNIATPSVVPATVTGNVWMPMVTGAVKAP